MKVNGRTITIKDAGYYYFLKYSNFCCDKLEKAGFSLDGSDLKTDIVCVMKHKNPKKIWESFEEREVYHFDSYIDAAESLLGITRETFEFERMVISE